MEPQHHGARVLGAEAFFHYPGPHPSGRPELGHLFEQIVLGYEEEGQPRAEVVDLKSGIEGCLDIGDGVGEGESQFLHRRSPGLTHVVAGDTDGVPLGHIFVAVLEHVHHQPHGWPGRVGIGAPGYVFLKNIVLHSAADLFLGNALLPGRHYIEAQQQRSGGVDGHGGADLIQGYAVEQGLHVQ